MKGFLLLTVISCMCFAVNCRTSEILKVKLSHGGSLVGRYLSTFKGKGIRGFLGIPYAKPPTGDLRFKAPLPFGSWDGERDATQDSSICIQRDPFRRDVEIEGSEDCLYLNVYTPIRDDEKTAKPLPVMVFFHGGGWQCGSGISMFYGPDFIMERENIIYIGANFRLGPLGFLSTGTKDCPGNNGLKDQVEVLRWIKENIAAFGGDPNKVTVFGESAGGASGTYHMMSPLSKGLFHQVISQSGANFNPWAQPAHKGVAEKRAAKLGEMMGCEKKDNNWAEMMDCLRKAPAEDITKAFYDFFAWDTDPMIPFPPVVEPDLPGAFISVHPRDVKQPHGLSVTWMAGLTADEGAMKSAPIINLKEVTNDMHINWDHALETSLYYDHHDDKTKQKITKRINEYYFKNRKIEPATHQNLTNLYTDSWFLHGMDEYFRYRLNPEHNSDSKRGLTFVYLFNHKASASFTEIFKGGRENYFGVSHAEELQFLFPIAKWLFVSAVPTKEDLQIRDALVQMWTDFAIYGHPTPYTSKLTTWEEATEYPVQYLRIGNKDQESSELIKMEKGLLQERANFWYEIGAHLPAKDVKDEL